MKKLIIQNKTQKIASYLRRRLKMGKYGVGEKLPSAVVLAAEFGVTKETVNMAVSHLVSENIVYRKQGSGTFVVDRKQKTNLIGIVLPGEAAGMFFSSIIKGIDSSLNLYHQIVKFSDHGEQKEKECLDELLSIDVDGIILAVNHPLYSKKNVEFLVKEKIPFVLIDKYIQELDTDYVVFDNFKAGYIATKRLIRLGHEKIAFVLSRVNDFTSVKENLAGYRSALEESGLDADAYIVKSEAGQTDYAAIEKLLDMKTPPTAIVTYHINKIENVLRARNLTVPDDISVVKYGKYKNPYDIYTCIEFFTKKMASQAAEILINKIEDSEIKESKQIKIEPMLVRGKSIAEFGMTDGAPRLGNKKVAIKKCYMESIMSE